MFIGDAEEAADAVSNSGQIFPFGPCKQSPFAIGGGGVGGGGVGGGGVGGGGVGGGGVGGGGSGGGGSGGGGGKRGDGGGICGASLGS